LSGDVRIDEESTKGADVAVIGGTGALGSGVAVRLAAAGLEVVLGSRDAARAESAAAQLSDQGGYPIKGAANEDAVIGARLVIVAVPFGSQASTLKSVAGSLVCPGRSF
jgi:hypothetical protein